MSGCYSTRPPYRLHVIIMAIALLMGGLAIPSAQAQEGADTQKETLITAQQMTSDQTSGIVTAMGKVEIVHAGYILHADKVTYNQNTDVVHAEGHIALLSPSGEVQFAESEDITGDMKEAFASNIGILYPDNSRLAARSVRRFDERWMLAKQGVYTSCNVCKENPDQAPLWQVSADTITHDNLEHDVYYHNATVDFWGVPILYMPYFSAPDPTVTRRQGFLAPTPGRTPTLGEFVRIPYYFDIAPDKDAVFAPTLSTKDKLQLAGQYRERFSKGFLQMDGSVTHADLISDTGADQGYQWRGNIVGKMVYNINNKWRAGTDIAYSSDKSYLQRYRLSSADELVNRAYLERFSGRNYAAVNSYYYEDLRPGARAVEPIVLPQASFSALGDPGHTWGGRWSMGGSLLTTMRDNSGQAVSQQGPNTRRMSLNGGWERRFTSDTGLTTTISGLVRSDDYWADNVIKTYDDGSTNTFNKVLLNRQFAQGNIMTSYPMGRRGDGYEQIIEPIVAITGAPNVKANDRQPIEDSLDVEYDETNLFSPNRFTGTDLIEGGSRVTYGLRQSINADNGMHAETFGGSSYSFERNDIFPSLSGLQRKASDIVWRINLEPARWLSLNYGTRLDRQSFSPQRQDASVAVGSDPFRVTTRYVSAYQTETDGYTGQVKSLVLGFNSKFMKYWSLGASHTQAFDPQPGPRSSSVSLNYNDECFVLGVTASQNDTNRVDLVSGTSVVFHFYMRNFGGIHTDSTTQTSFPSEFRNYE